MFAITRVIWQGRFASPVRLPELRAAGITHILNVCEAPHVLRAAEGPFVELASIAIDDLEPIPEPTALACLDTLHRMATTADSRVYLHCIAGCNRSPTILWLYLVACGLDPQFAKEQISARNIDAVPGHSRLVTPQLVARAIDHAQRFLPHPRPAALEFA
jgi:Swiss Army Knife protein, DSP-PTPase phosphatase domain